MVKPPKKDSTISHVELEALRHAFARIDLNKDGKVCQSDLLGTLTILGYECAQRDIRMMIWEVDEDLDGFISWEETLEAYTRSINDHHWLEPRNFMNLLQFIMFDKDNLGSISVEQSLQILFVRFGRERLDDEVAEIFGERGENQETRLNFKAYLDRLKQTQDFHPRSKPGVFKPQEGKSKKLAQTVKV